MRRLLLHVTVLALTASRVVIGAAAVKPAEPAPDEKIVAAIVEEMNSADFEVREAASQRLEAFGPDVVPFLEPYRTKGRPEVVARVNALIRSFTWMRQGAIVLYVKPSSQAAKLKLQVGDVLVKIDDTPVTSNGQFGEVRGDGERSATLHVWREGRTRRVEIKPGVIGITTSDWDITRGGVDQSKGLSLLVGPNRDLAAAYARLRAAHEAGMSDRYTYKILTALAARQFDDKLSAEAYRAMGRHSCELSHGAVDVEVHGLPFNSPHTRVLLGRVRAEPYESPLGHEAEDWFARRGRNGPMLAELLAKPWPAGPKEETYEQYHADSSMAWSLHERRPDDAWRVGSAISPKGYSDTTVLLLHAAVARGAAADATDVCLGMLGDEELSAEAQPQPALWGMALAAAVGDKASVDRNLTRIDKLTDAQRKVLEKLASVGGLNEPDAARALRTLFEGKPKRPGHPGVLEQVALAQLVADPASTVEQFDAFTRGRAVGNGSKDYDATMLTGLLRFGKYDQAAEHVKNVNKPPKSSSKEATGAAVRQVIEFAAAHRDELAGPWKELRGVVRVAARPKTNETWALRYDGEVFRVGADGSLRRFEGLPSQLPAPVTVAYGHIRFTAGLVVASYPFGRTSLADVHPAVPDVSYLLDEKASRWVPSTDWRVPIGKTSMPELAAAVQAGAVGRAYPPLAGTDPRAYERLDSGFIRFEGDVLVRVDPKTGKSTDLSAAVGKAAGLNRPARLYRPAPAVGSRHVLPGECGAWLFDSADASLRRIALGLADENVMTCTQTEQNYGRQPDGKMLLGVAPQQGGQMFAIDVKAAAAVAIPGGYNGLGPDDWYALQGTARYLDCFEADIYARRLARLALK